MNIEDNHRQAGRVHADQFTAPLEVRADAPPTGTLTVQPTGTVLPNHLVSYTVEAADDFGLAQVMATVTGALETVDEVTVSGTSATLDGGFRIPATATAGSTARLSVEIVDGVGQRTDLPPVELEVLADGEAPVVTVLSTANRWPCRWVRRLCPATPGPPPPPPTGLRPAWKPRLRWTGR